MRFHLPAIPGMKVTKDNSSCAYTQKIRKYVKMMGMLGHDVIVYGHEEHDLDCEYVPCYEDSGPIPFDPNLWSPFNVSAARAIMDRREHGDFLGVIGGRAQQEIDVMTDIPGVEYGIGYGGVFSDYKVFESYAWMHTVYGSLGGSDPHSVDGRFYDRVIPNYFDREEFHPGEDEGYLLYIGRLIERKGVHIASMIAEKTGLELAIAGEGDFRPSTGTYVGSVGPELRARLMANAKAVLVPTIYVEPFGGVAVEAMMCGTPVITTDWGAFTETVIQGFNGYRCRTLGEFVKAVELVESLDRDSIRRHALDTYSLEAIGPRYEAYFESLTDLMNGGGWYSGWEGLSERPNHVVGDTSGSYTPDSQLELL